MVRHTIIMIMLESFKSAQICFYMKEIKVWSQQLRNVALS